MKDIDPDPANEHCVSGLIRLRRTAGHNVSSVKQAELSQAQSGAVIFGFRRSSAVLEVATLRLSHAVEQLSKMLAAAMFSNFLCTKSEP